MPDLSEKPKRSEQESLDHYRRLSHQIDSLLEGSVRTLIDVGQAYASRTPKAPPTGVPSKGEQKSQGHQHSDGPLRFPPWLSENQEPNIREKYLLTQALCCATLQKVWLQRRRFAWLQTDTKRLETLKALQDRIQTTFRPQTPDFKGYIERLHSENFGPLNPYTASQVFRALLFAGESEAHRGTGFWAFFAVMGSLLRKFPEGKVSGAALEPWGPTAYITAKCLFPIERLCSVCVRRGKLFLDIKKQMERLRTLAQNDNGSHYNHWLFVSNLDQLSILLSDISVITVNKEAFDECAKKIEILAGELTTSDDSSKAWKRIRGHIYEVLQHLGERNIDLRDQARKVVGLIECEICLRMETDEGREALKRLKLHIDPPPGREKEYWDDHIQASTEALKLCRIGLENLEYTARLAQELESSNGDCICSEERLFKILEDLSQQNLDFAKKLREKVGDCATWCHSVVEREIAHASAENYTDFDPAELVSGIAAAVRCGGMTSRLEVSDAIKKALTGARPDGSWSAGQPFYTSGRILAGYASTSDIVWELGGAIMRYPEIDVADEALERYVAWLERTMCQISWRNRELRGWASERSREPNVIDLRSTSLAINALFEIRNLLEYRLWQLCQRRFNVVPVSLSLSDIEPVDLGARHGKRLHRRLSKMARDAEIDNEGKAEYSFILHGPPGSSKTVMAQALSEEMWRSLGGSERQKLVRITPADFTRHGEDRIDSEARLIFDLLQGVRGVTVFFDEVDDLLRKREIAADPTFIKLVVPAMLNRLADLREACPRQQICFLIGTNFIENIEPALIRRGRVDAAIPVVYPDFESRHAILERHIARLESKIKQEKDNQLKEQYVNSVKALETHKEHVVRQTVFWPWTIIDGLCKELKTMGEPISQRAVSRLLEEYQGQVSNLPYLHRLTGSQPCSELLKECIHYSFADGGNKTAYEEGLGRLLDSWSVSLPDGHKKELRRKVTDTAIRMWREDGRNEQASTNGRKRVLWGLLLGTGTALVLRGFYDRKRRAA